MSFFFNLKSTTTKCINGCVLFNDTSNFSYWENKKTTSDEEHIVEYLKTNNLVSGKNIMHIGVGNSYFVKNISNYNKVDAITLSKKEMDYGLSFNIRNYNIFFQNKYSYKNLLNETLKSYDKCPVQLKIGNVLPKFSSKNPKDSDSIFTTEESNINDDLLLLIESLTNLEPTKRPSARQAFEKLSKMELRSVSDQV